MDIVHKAESYAIMGACFEVIFQKWHTNELCGETK